MWKVTRLEIAGVKGVLDSAGTFDFRDGKSLALYAPNACGKSGYADAIEYLFSRDGEVAHLGKGGADSELGGKHAIAHVLAAGKGIVPTVQVRLRDSQRSQVVDASRRVNVGRDDPLPAQLAAIVDGAPGYRILRQHDLRRFVVDLGPREKYGELSKWMGMECVEGLLAHLTTAANELNRAAPSAEIRERTRDIATHTDGAVTSLDVPAILKWCWDRTRLHVAGCPEPHSVAELAACVKPLQEKRNELLQAAGLVTQKASAKVALEKFVDGLTTAPNLLATVRTQVDAAEEAEKAERLAAESLVGSPFKDTWEAATKLLEEAKPEQCPVCLTPWHQGAVGSRDQAIKRMKAGLESLQRLRDATTTVQTAHASLRASLAALRKEVTGAEQNVATLGLATIAEELAAIGKSLEALVACDVSAPVRADECRAVLSTCAKTVGKLAGFLNELVIDSDSQDVQAVDVLVGHVAALLNAITRLVELQRLDRELRAVAAAFKSITDVVLEELRQYQEGIIGNLKSDVSTIYSKVHPQSVIPAVHLECSVESKSLRLRVDFFEPGRTVPPAGYLSESQISTLGLALFVACVKAFNASFPFVFLDDIVSSYDAEHRARIADVIAEELSEFQVMLTTHDEVFYRLLKDRLSTRGWLFERIRGWTLLSGPSRETEATTPEIIQATIAAGSP